LERREFFAAVVALALTVIVLVVLYAEGSLFPR
jgi:hypothetical protein